MFLFFFPIWIFSLALVCCIASAPRYWMWKRWRRRRRTRRGFRMHESDSLLAQQSTRYRAYTHQFAILFVVSYVQFSKWFICLWKRNDFTRAAVWMPSPQRQSHRSPLFSQPIGFQFFYFIVYFFRFIHFHVAWNHMPYLSLWCWKSSGRAYASNEIKTLKKNTEVKKGRVWWIWETIVNTKNEMKTILRAKWSKLTISSVGVSTMRLQLPAKHLFTNSILLLFSFFICEISVTQRRWTAYDRRLASENTFPTKNILSKIDTVERVRRLIIAVRHRKIYRTSANCECGRMQ